MKISEAREMVYQVVFQIDFHSDFDGIYQRLIDEMPFKGGKKEYAVSTVEGIISNKDEIDATIKENLKDWTFDRLSKPVVALLRLGIYEMIYNDGIPMVSAINEAVQLAYKYCEEKECVFINGLLHRLYTQKKSEE